MLEPAVIPPIEGDANESSMTTKVIPGRRRGFVLALAVGLAALGASSVVAGAATTPDAGWVRPLLFVGGLIVIAAALRLFGRLAGGRLDIGLLLSVAWMALLIIAAICADWLPLAESRDVSKTLQEPILVGPDLFSKHPLGTDRQGLDILGGVIYGARVSLVVALGAVAIGTVVGGLVGLLAGWFRRKADWVVRFTTDSMLAFPPLILLLAMVSVLGASVLNVTVALAVLSIPIYVRLSRVNTLVFAQRDFVTASRILGARGRRIILRELLPNVAVPVLAYGFTVVGVLIVAEASLSFLGLSVSRPSPTWGNMIAAGQTDFNEHPHTVLGPGIVLFLTVFTLNQIGDRARALWSPSQRSL